MATSTLDPKSTGTVGARGRTSNGKPASVRIADIPSAPDVKLSWSCRSLNHGRSYRCLGQDRTTPRAGDVAVVEVAALGKHSRLSTLPVGKQRLYPGDLLVGVFGNRYATDAFEAEVRTTDDLHIVTDAGMIGTVLSRHRNVPPPTTVRFVGYVADEAGQRVNLKALHAQERVPEEVGTAQILLIVGTAMNSGKTTVAARLVKSLVRRGARVAAYKLTGSVCQKDANELRSAGAQDVRDFSDYGFPSTYLSPPDELLDLFHRMRIDASEVHPDIVVMEIADGLLQRETTLLLEHEEVRSGVGGVLLAAPCASSALFAVGQLALLGHQTVAVSGRVTSSPLGMQEFASRSHVPIKPSAGDAHELAEVVLRHFRIATS